MRVETSWITDRACDAKAFKTSTPSVIKLTGADGPGGGVSEEKKSTVPGQPGGPGSSSGGAAPSGIAVLVPSSSSLSDNISDATVPSDGLVVVCNNSIDYVVAKPETTTMSFVLQLENVDERDKSAIGSATSSVVRSISTTDCSSLSSFSPSSSSSSSSSSVSSTLHQVREATSGSTPSSSLPSLCVKSTPVVYPGHNAQQQPRLLTSGQITKSTVVVTSNLGGSTTSSSSCGPSKLVYPVSRAGSRDVPRQAGSQTSTEQTLTTRVVSQKLPLSTIHQQQQSNATPSLQASSGVTTNAAALSNPATAMTPSNLPHPTIKTAMTANSVASSGLPQAQAAAISSQNSNQPSKTPSTTHEANKANQQQQTSMATVTAVPHSPVHQKLQLPVQHMVNSLAGIKPLNAIGSLPNVHRLQVKTPGVTVTGGISQQQTVNFQKVKAIASVNSPGTVHRTPVSRIQTVPKNQQQQQSQASLTTVGQCQTQQVTINQVLNNASMQRVQQPIVQKTVVQNAAGKNSSQAQQQQQQQGFANQKVVANSGNNPNSKAHQPQTQQQQQQQQQINQQAQVIQHKLPVMPQKTLAVQRHQQQQQQQHSAVINNVQKPLITPATKNSQQTGQVSSQGQQQPQKIVTSGASIGQQSRAQGATPVLQKSQTMPVQRAAQLGVIAGGQQKIGTVAGIIGNQRSQTVVSGKVQLIQQAQQQTQQQQQQQQGMVMRVGPTKVQPQGIKQQKTANVVKQANPQGVVQSPTSRAGNATPVKIIQQANQQIQPPQQQQQANLFQGQQQQQQQQHHQQSNSIANCPPITPKQPGCIKTIPAQKPTLQRNNAQHKVTGIKTSLNTNMSALKSQTSSQPGGHKTSIRTLLPQQAPGASSVHAHKSQPVKIQQQCVQQKQLIMTPQYGQQARSQPGQIKTMLPITNTENRRDNDAK